MKHGDAYNGLTENTATTNNTKQQASTGKQQPQQNNQIGPNGYPINHFIGNNPSTAFDNIKNFDFGRIADQAHSNSGFYIDPAHGPMMQTFNNLLENQTSFSVAPKEVEEFIENIKSVFEQKNMKIKVENIGSISAYRFTTDKSQMGVILLMGELLRSDGRLSQTETLNTFDPLARIDSPLNNNQTVIQKPIVSIIENTPYAKDQAYVVTKTDYDRTDKWASIIRLNLTQFVIDGQPAGAMNVDHARFAVTRDQSYIKSVINGYSPFTIGSYATDFFMLYASDTQRNVSNAPVPLMAVGVYVDFKIDTKTSKLRPIIHVSDVYGFLPHRVFFTTLLTFIIQTYVLNNGWTQRIIAGEDGDIANYSYDSVKRTCGASSSIEERAQYINMYCDTPTLVIDHVKGRNTCVFLRYLLEDPNVYCKMDAIDGTISDYASRGCTTWTGYALQDGVSKDTRGLQFLQAMKLRDSYEHCVPLTMFTSRPQDLIARQREIYSVVIDPLFEVDEYVVRSDCFSQMITLARRFNIAHENINAVDTSIYASNSFGNTGFIGMPTLIGNNGFGGNNFGM